MENLDGALLPTAALALAVVALVAIAYVATTSTGGSKYNLNIPYVDFEDGKKTTERYARETGSLMKRGYEQYLKKGLPFAMFNCLELSKPIVILPMKYLAEVRGASASKLNFPEFMNRSIVAKDILAPLVTERVVKVAKLDLNKSLNDLIPAIQETCSSALTNHLPHSKDYTPQNIQMLFWAPISRIMTLVLVGPELKDNEDWNFLVGGYLLVGQMTAKRVRETYPSWLRWTAKYIDKYVYYIRYFRWKGERMLKPLIKDRVADYKKRAAGGGKGKPGFNDGIQWLVDSYLADGEKVKVGSVMQDMSFLMSASLHGILMNGVTILYDLVERPEALREIREEIARVEEANGEKGWNRQSLGSLLALDSFMKESQRLHTFQHYTMQRIALQDHTFKDGLQIPAGTWLQMSSRMHGSDPTIVPDGDKFDPMRWKKLRENGDVTKNHFASVHDEMLPWGSGAHACPGRFLVQDVLKLIFIHLLSKHDLAFENGERPADWDDNTGTMPNTGANILVKERVV
ncbi:cytochrome P450 [Aspergillus karnatakaensis]|uniref:cytochrome P450 n=1 Tax=Aspergillus karnatakaensis TaxID=1810916 RepID=UPI003CCE4099